MVKHCEVFTNAVQAFKATADKGSCKVGRINRIWYVIRD
jgi:hypothetical protein